jgi:peptidoglycan/LPS O-acetylase OafA/YrhL
MGAWRLALAWLVVADHTSGLNEISANLGIGKIAVSTFFFVSGFLMPLTFDTHYRAYGMLAGSRKFYVNRFLRIYPIYWASLAVTLLAVIVYGPALMEHATTPGDLSRVRPAWTLDIELQYYALVPVILWMTAYRRRAAAAAMAAFAAASLYLFFRPVGILDIDRSLLAWSFFFLLGYAFYLLPGLQALTRRKRWLIAAVAALILIASLSRHRDVAILCVTLACMTVSSYLLVLQQSGAFGRRDRLLGDLSYPTYILHWICVQLLWLWLGHSVADLPAAGRFSILLVLNVSMSTLVAYASLRAIGDPIEMLRRRIRDGRLARARPG